MQSDNEKKVQQGGTTTFNMYVFGEGELSVESIKKPEGFQVDVQESKLDGGGDYRHIQSAGKFYKATRLPIKVNAPQNAVPGKYDIEVNFGKPTLEESGVKVERVQGFDFEVEVIERKVRQNNRTIDLGSIEANNSDKGGFKPPEIKIPEVSPWLITLITIWVLVAFVAKRELS